jgi:hypothetical protein
VTNLAIQTRVHADVVKPFLHVHVGMTKGDRGNLLCCDELAELMSEADALGRIEEEVKHRAAGVLPLGQPH